MNEKTQVTDEDVQKRVETGRQYTLRLYKAGPHRDQPPEQAQQIQAAHLRYLMQLHEEGKLLMNGPVVNDAVLKGVSIFDTTDVEEVKRLSEDDPAVQAGRLVYEIYTWFGIPGDGLPEA